MKPLLLALMVLASTCCAQEAKVRATSERMGPGDTMGLRVTLNFKAKKPSRPTATRAFLPGEAPVFRVSVSRTGKQPASPLVGQSIVGGEWGYANAGSVNIETLPVQDQSGDWNVHTTADLTYKSAPEEAAGTVTVVVEPFQGKPTGGSGNVYRGHTDFYIVPDLSRTGRAAQPPARPPYRETDRVVNPTTAILTLVTVIAIILAALGTTQWGRNSAQDPRPDPPPAEPPAPGKAAQRPPDPLPPRPPVEQPAFQIATIRKKTQRAWSDRRGVVRSYDYLGSADEWIQIAVIVTATPGWVVQLEPSSARNGWEDDPMPAWYSEPVPPGAVVRYLRQLIPWQWDDLHTTPHRPAVTFALVRGSATHQFTAPGAAIEPIMILGAKPEIVTEAEPLELLATGRHSTELTPTLWLFDAPTLGETVTVSTVSGLPGADFTDGFRLRAPFLIQEPGHVEVRSLQPTVKWTGGPLWSRARDHDRHPPRIEPCEIHVLGCHARLTEPRTDRFCPVPGTPLFTGAQLLDGHGQPIDDPFGPGALHGPGASIRCQLRDLSQGMPGESHGCKLPPEFPEDSSGTPVCTLRREDLSVGPQGHVQTVQESKFFESTKWSPGGTPPADVVRDRPPRIQLWRYELRAGHQPIHDAPVCYELVFDDGFEGRQHLRGHCRATLGSLILETGGEDFKIFEYRPFAFEVRYDPGGAGYVPKSSDENFQLRWQFAQVDEHGNPERSLGGANPGFDIHTGRARLLVGHMPEHRAKIHVHLTDGSISFSDNLYGPEWHTVTPSDRTESLDLRRVWHTADTHPVPAFPWMNRAGERLIGTPAEWTDRAARLAVRLELTDADGHLLATSDRLAAPFGRTPAQHVWRDHRFAYVLMALRLQLRDAQGRYLRARSYRIHASGQIFSGITSPAGAVEWWPPPDADTATLELLGAPDTAPACVFELVLGGLDELGEEGNGVTSRLDNLGYGASIPFGPDEELSHAMQRYQRALERFTARSHLPVAPGSSTSFEHQTDAAFVSVRKQLEEDHEC